MWRESVTRFCDDEMRQNKSLKLTKRGGKQVSDAYDSFAIYSVKRGEGGLLPHDVATRLNLPVVHNSVDDHREVFAPGRKDVLHC